jgi:hypothetical protein
MGSSLDSANEEACRSSRADGALWPDFGFATPAFAGCARGEEILGQPFSRNGLLSGIYHHPTASLRTPI